MTARRRLIFFSLIVLLALFSISFLVKIAISEYSIEEPSEKNSKGFASGRIDPDVFARSVPTRMIIGKTYAVVLVVANTGNTTADFLVSLHFSFQASAKYLYARTCERNLTLCPGESQRTAFDLTAIGNHAGPLVLTGYLYSALPDQISLVDSTSATIYEIGPAFAMETMLWIGGVIAFLGFVAAIAIFRRRRTRSVHFKQEFIIAFMLFLVALSLRAYNLSRLATYPDEATFEMGARAIIHNGWKWPRELMMGSYPPLIFDLQAVLIYLFGTSSEILRSVSTLFGSLTVVIVYFLGKSLFDRKVGVLAALLLCFSSFHILYSRLATSESLVLFLLTISSYLFWTGYRKKSWRQMLLSGVFLALGLDTKYISLVAVASLVLFVVWSERSGKSFLRKELLIFLMTLLIAIAPVQLSLLQNGVNPYWSYLSQAFGTIYTPEQVNRPFLEFIPRGLKIFIYLLDRTASPWLPWLPAYELAAIILLTVSIVYHIYLSLRRRANASFTLLLFLMPVMFVALMPVRHTYWLIYGLPYTFIMFSNLIVRCTYSLRVTNALSSHHAEWFRQHSHSAPLKISILLFAGIFVFSNFVVGASSPTIDRGEYEGARLAMQYLKNRVRGGEYVASWWGTIILRYINQYDLNVTYVPLDMDVAEGGPASYAVSDHVLSLKTRFIVLPMLYYDFYFNSSTKEYFLKNYDVTSWRPSLGYFWPESTYQNWMVLERKMDDGEV